jgi:hypothetical protein
MFPPQSAQRVGHRKHRLDLVVRLIPGQKKVVFKHVAEPQGGKLVGIRFYQGHMSTSKFFTGRRIRHRRKLY